MLVLVVSACVLMLSTCALALANSHIGMQSAGGNDAYRGARVNIYNYNPRYSSSGFVCAWPMLLNTQFDSSHALAQVGWLRGSAVTGNNGVYYFWEYEATSGDPVGLRLLGALPNPLNYGTSHLYTVQYDQSIGRIQFRIDGVWQAQVGYDWLPNKGEWMGEIVNDPADQVPGDTAHKCRFWNPSAYSNGAWHVLNPSGDRMFDNCSEGRWSYSVQNSWFHIWDQRYSTQGGM